MISSIYTVHRIFVYLTITLSTLSPWTTRYFLLVIHDCIYCICLPVVYNGASFYSQQPNAWLSKHQKACKYLRFMVLATETETNITYLLSGKAPFVINFYFEARQTSIIFDLHTKKILLGLVTITGSYNHPCVSSLRNHHCGI